MYVQNEKNGSGSEGLKCDLRIGCKEFTYRFPGKPKTI